MTTNMQFEQYILELTLSSEFLSDKTYSLLFDIGEPDAEDEGTQRQQAWKLETLQQYAGEWKISSETLSDWLSDCDERYQDNPGLFDPACWEGFEGFEGFVTGGTPVNAKFPVEELTQTLLNEAVATGEDLQVAVDMPAGALLSVSALCGQRKFKANPKPGWLEPVNLFTAIVAKPSERKSPVLSRVMEPVRAYQREENERRKPLVKSYQVEVDVLNARIEDMKKRMVKGGGKGKTPTKEDMKLLQVELEELEANPVKLVSLYADDITPEALAQVIANNGEKMAIVSAEGGIFDTMGGRYSNSIPNLDLLLKAFSMEYYRVDRIGRKPVAIQHPALTLLLMVQPSVLGEIMRNETFSGRGLLARFLYIVPESMVGKRKFNTAPVPKEFEADYADLVRELLEIPEEPVKIIHFTPEAQAALETYSMALEPRLTDDLEPIEDWAGKLVGKVVRIAALLHICDHRAKAADIPLPAETVRRACVLGDYFLEQAKIAYSMMGLMEDKTTRDARYIMKRIDQSGEYKMKKRDLHQLCKNRSGFEKASGMEPALKLLIDHGYIKIQKAPPAQNPQNPQKVGRPSLMVYVNPEYTQWRKEHPHD